MTYLVDANVLSEATKPKPMPAVVHWLRAHERAIVIDPVIIGELRFGILLLPTGVRRRKLEQWFDRGISKIHCVDWDATTGLRWANLLAMLRRTGRAMPIKDSMVAATALRYGLTVATRNTSDFASAGVSLINPFEA